MNNRKANQGLIYAIISYFLYFIPPMLIVSIPLSIVGLRVSIKNKKGNNLFKSHAIIINILVLLMSLLTFAVCFGIFYLFAWYLSSSKIPSIDDIGWLV